MTMPEPVLTVSACAVANNATAGHQTLDGVVVSDGAYVLLTDQTTASQNGVWRVAFRGWTQISAPGLVFVQGGTSYVGTLWNAQGNVWTQAGDAIVYTGGQGVSVAAGVIGLTGAVSENVVAVGGAAQTLPAVATHAGSDITLSANLTVTMPTAARGASCYARVHQAATGGPFTVTWTGVLWAGGVAPTMTITVSAIDLYEFQSDGTSWYNTITAQALA